MYPEFIADAEAEGGDRRAIRSFKWALEVEKIHEGLYQEALANLDQTPDEIPDYWVCPVCGHTHVGPEPPERCPICGAEAERYLKVE